MYSGVIEVSPRYCPSIEDKIHRFAGKGQPPRLPGARRPGHRIYPTGSPPACPSTSSWASCARSRAWRTVTSCARATPSEYDYFDPHCNLKSSPGDQIHRRALLKASQINSTATRKPPPKELLAGLNAALRVKGPRTPGARGGTKPTWACWWTTITRGVSETLPHVHLPREFRLSLREDSINLRLTEAGRRLGLVDDIRWAAFCAKREGHQAGARPPACHLGHPAKVPAEEPRRPCWANPSSGNYSFFDLLRRPGVSCAALMTLPSAPKVRAASQVVEQLEIAAKYQGYIDRQRDEVARQADAESTRLLPADLDFLHHTVRGLSKRKSRAASASTNPKPSAGPARIQGITRRPSACCWVAG